MKFDYNWEHMYSCQEPRDLYSVQNIVEC